jgi:uncharacterized membrane protein
VVLFGVTLMVIVLIVISMLRWIAHLSRFGQVGDTTARVEEVTRRALQDRIDSPCLGAHPLPDPLPALARPLYPERSMYLQHLDAGALSECAETHQLTLCIVAQPGCFVHPAAPLLWFTGTADEDVRRALRSSFTLGELRSFDQDPRFGLSVLAEIASRALSPAINDPGTAIDILGRGVRLLSGWVDRAEPTADSVCHPRLRMAPLALDDLFDDLFGPIVRDGATRIEVQLRLLKALQALAARDGCFLAPARRLAAEVAALAEEALPLTVDRERIRRQVAQLRAMP